MLKNDDFILDYFEGSVIFENFWPTSQNFQKAVEISVSLKIIRTLKIHIEKFFKTSGRLLLPILASGWFWE